MKTFDTDAVLAELEEHYYAVSEKHTVFATMLYGSQNYLMADEHSDVDSKTMILPDFGEFALRSKLISYEMPIGEALTNIKDVRAMTQNFLSSNINFLECLFTPHTAVSLRYVDFWDELQAARDTLANCNPNRLMHAAHGMATQKKTALTKHFPSKEEVLRLYGYDAKQLYHLRRLYFFMRSYLETADFGASLVPTEQQRQELWELKQYTLPLRTAEAYATCIMRSCHELLDKADAIFPANPPSAIEAKKWYDDFNVRILRTHLINELKEGAYL